MSSAAIAISKQNRLIRRFENCGAVSESSAVTLTELKLSSSFIFKRLVSRGVFVRISGERYYLDLDVAEKFKRSRKTKILIIVALAIAVVLFLQFRG